MEVEMVPELGPYAFAVRSEMSRRRVKMAKKKVRAKRKGDLRRKKKDLGRRLTVEEMGHFKVKAVIVG